MASLEGNEPDYGAAEEEARRKAQLSMLGAASGNAPPSPDQNVAGWTSTDVFANTPSKTTSTSTTTGGGGGGGGGAQQQATTPAFQAPQSFSGGGGGVNIANATPATNPAITDEVTALLRARLQSLSNPMDLTTDPIYQNQLKTFGVEAERSKERERAALAQRMYARGTSTGGGLDTGVRGLEEQQSQRSQAYGANLAAERFADREAQLNQAISYARAVGQDEVARQLENEKMKLAVEALRVQQSLGQQDIDLRAFLGQGQLGLGAGQLGLGYDQLGFSYADMITRANNAAAASVL